MNSQHTMALVFAVRNDESLMMTPSSLSVFQATPSALPYSGLGILPVREVAVDHGKDAAAERPYRRRFGRRRKSENDRAQHHQDQQREREK
jgi:hypothetical protein